MDIEKLSIIIPAHNEEEELPRCLSAIQKSLQACTKPPVTEILVVANRCDDRTVEIAKAQGCQVIENDYKNLSMIRNHGVRSSSGELIVTIDADSRVSENMFENILSCMRSGKFIGGGVVILPERWSLGIFCTALMLLPVALYHQISAGLFFFMREDFEAIAGFDEKKSSAEDIDFAVRLRKYGKETGRKYKNFLNSYIITSMRKFDHFGDWYFVKNWRQSYRLLRSEDDEAAKKIWYHFKR